MSRLVDAVEQRARRLASWVYRRPKLSLVVALVLLVGSSASVGRLRLDTSMTGLFHEDDPARLAFESLRETFGCDDVLVILLQPPELFDAAFLGQLGAIHRQLEAEVPHVAAITSLVNARRTYGVGDRLVVEDLMDEAPATAEAVAALRAVVMGSPLYRGSLVSADWRFTGIVVEPEVPAVASGLERRSGSVGRGLRQAQPADTPA